MGQPALGCRDIPMEFFPMKFPMEIPMEFPLLGNMDATSFVLWGLHMSSVISDPKSIDGMGLWA